jgi:hypothetical protein
MSSLTVPKDFYDVMLNWIMIILGEVVIASSFYIAGRFAENKHVFLEKLLKDRTAKVKRIFDEFNLEDLESCQN